MLLAVLLACSSSPAGRWSGEIACADEDGEGTITVDLRLRREEALRLRGPGEVDFDGQFRIQGAWRSYREELDFDELLLELESEGGPQEARLRGEAVQCQTWVDGTLSSADCDGGDALDWVLQWDGADRLQYAAGDCAGELRRGG